MARFLALDWDGDKLIVIAAALKGGTVRLQRAVAIPEPLPFNGAEAEALGKRLREQLNAAGISPAPVLACIGRDRLILKEVRFPAVAPHEEPALVRFQVVKELTDSADDVVIDYATVSESASERRALALVARRDLVAAYQAILKAAGLKLAGLTPRPFGTLACLKRIAGATVRTPAPEPPGAPVAVVMIGRSAAEFSVLRGDALVFSRSLNGGPMLAGEIRRSIAVYDGQATQNPIRALYIAGTSEQAELRERLQDALGIPVHPFDPFDGQESPELPAENRGAFAAAVGLLYIQAARKPLAINFIQPKQPRPPSDPKRKKALIAAGVGMVCVVGSVVYCVASLAKRNSELQDRYIEKADLDQRIARFDDQSKQLKALDDWSANKIVWLDELYDVVDCFPNNTQIRLKDFIGGPKTRAGKDKQVATMTIKGITSDENAVKEMQDALVLEEHYRVDAFNLAINSGSDRREFRQQFTTNIDLEKRLPAEYKRKLSDDGPGRTIRGRPGNRGGGRRPGGNNFPNFGNFGGNAFAEEQP